MSDQIELEMEHPAIFICCLIEWVRITLQNIAVAVSTPKSILF